MPDETNLTMEAEGFDDSGLDDLSFDDETGEEGTEAAETTGEGTDEAEESKTDEETEEADGEDAGEAKDEPLFEVKYNGKLMKLTLPELIANAQKGLNYDHVTGERDTLREHAKWLEDVAKNSGFKSVEDMKKATDAQIAAQKKIAREQERKALEEKLPGNNEVIDELLTLREKTAQLERENNDAQKKREAQERQNKLFVDFWTEFPEFRDKPVKEYPAEVQEALLRGGDPIRVMQRVEIEELKRKNKAAEQNAANRDKAPGSAKGTARQRLEDDPFLQGFFSVD